MSICILLDNVGGGDWVVHDVCVFDCGEYYRTLKSRRVVGDNFSFPPLYTTYLRHYSVQCFFSPMMYLLLSLLLLLSESNENTIMSKKE
jgi:hypothetical protein